MQKLNKKLLIILSVTVILILIVGSFILNKKNQSNSEYYYTFKYDDNLISQSVMVYDSKDEIQTNYYIFYQDDVVTLTEGEKAVLTIAKLDLKDHPDLELLFYGEKEKHTVKFKK